MKRIPKFSWVIVPAVLVVLLVAGAVGVSAAAASSPEILNREGKEVVHKHFTGGGPEVTFEGRESGELIKCTLSSESGEITSVKSLKMTVTYQSCTSSFFKEPCKNTGLPTGEMVAKLVGKPVFLDEKHTETGLAFEPEVKNGTFVSCLGTTVGVHEAEKGGLDTALASFSGEGTNDTLSFDCTSGQQKFRSYWEGEKSITGYLEAGGLVRWQEGCVHESGDHLQFEENVRLAAGPPVVTTTAATSVEGTSATLNGTVNPRGVPTTYFFHYSGGNTTEVSAGEGNTPVPVSATVTGLTPGTVYKYYVVARSAAGPSNGAEMSFLAKPAKFKPAKGPGSFPVAFASSGGVTVIETEAEGRIECKQQTGAGKFTSAKEAKLSLQLTECSSVALGGVKCGTLENGKTGVIETKEMAGVVDYTDPTKITSEGRETGLALSPVSGEVIAEINCTSLAKVTVKGSMIAVVSPLNTQTKTLAVSLKRSGFAQIPSEYEAEGGAKVAAALTCSLNGATAKPCAEESSPSLTLSGEEGLLEAY
jgi:hypothetical protein